MPKKWEAIASDPAHFGGNRREAVERCYALHCEPKRELTDAEIDAINDAEFSEFPFRDEVVRAQERRACRAILAAYERKQREPETVTFRAARRIPDGGVAMFQVPCSGLPNENLERIEPAQTIEVVVS